jgi:hypothetical protein
MTPSDGEKWHLEWHQPKRARGHIMTPVIRTTGADSPHDKLIIEIRFPKGMLASALVPIVMAASAGEDAHLKMPSIEVTVRQPVEATVPEHTDPRPVGAGAILREATVLATTSTGGTSQPFTWDPSRPFIVRIPTRAS